MLILICVIWLNGMDVFRDKLHKTLNLSNSLILTDHSAVFPPKWCHFLEGDVIQEVLVIGFLQKMDIVTPEKKTVN